jgi:hypothetical protein
VSRRKPPLHHWHVGDSCQVSHTYWFNSRPRTSILTGEVVAVRGERVVVDCYGFESEHCWWELRVPPKPRGNAIARIFNRFGHDRHRRTV